MKKIFLDVGAYDGDSIKKFRKYVGNHKIYEIHAFEPNPNHWKHFPESDTSVTLHKEAVWIYDGDIDFFVGEQSNGIGSTLMADKTTGQVDYDNPVPSKCIDFDRWIKENCSKEDFIILKMDIEGGEFKVIPHMMKGGSFDYLNEIWIEIHPNKIKKYLSTDKLKMVEDIKKYDILYKDWR